MDHSWGRNVTDLLGFAEYTTLCTPILTLPGFLLTNRPAALPSIAWTWIASSGPNAQWFPVGVVKPNPGSNFPYGFAVSPDVPL